MNFFNSKFVPTYVPFPKIFGNFFPFAIGLSPKRKQNANLELMGKNKDESYSRKDASETKNAHHIDRASLIHT